MRSHTNVGEKNIWLQISALIQTYYVLIHPSEDYTQTNEVLPHQTYIHVIMELALCTGEQSVWNLRGHPHTVHTESGACIVQNILVL